MDFELEQFLAPERRGTRLPIALQLVLEPFDLDGEVVYDASVIFGAAMGRSRRRGFAVLLGRYDAEGERGLEIPVG